MTQTRGLHSSQIAQFLWVRGALSTMEKICLLSFLNHGYAVHLYTYETVTGVPDGVKLCNGQEILPRERLFLAQGVTGESYAAFSDLFRYHLLLQKGGWWFDIDCLSIRQLPEPASLLVASSWEAHWQQVPGGCALWAPPDNIYMKWLVAEAENLIAQQTVDFGSIGPRLICRLIDEHSLQSAVAPWWEFSPYPWRLIQRLVQNNCIEWSQDIVRGFKQFLHEKVDKNFKAGGIRPGTRALHLHNEIWKLRELDKDAQYFPWCFWERAKQKVLKESQRRRGKDV